MSEQIIDVIDDEQDIRSVVKTFLENEGFTVRTFESADIYRRDLTDKICQLRSEENENDSKIQSYQLPDLILLDIMMPGEDGLSLCNAIRRGNFFENSKTDEGRHSENYAEYEDEKATPKSRLRQLATVPIIFMSAKDSPLDRVTGLTMGSDDYIVKPFLPIELVARVKALLRRSAMLRPDSDDAEPETLACGNLRIEPAGHRVLVLRQISQPNGQATDSEPTAIAPGASDSRRDLTPTELAVTPMEFSFLLYLCRRKEAAVPKAEILKAIWDVSSYNADTRMADDLVKRLRKKLAAAGSPARVDYRVRGRIVSRDDL